MELYKKGLVDMKIHYYFIENGCSIGKNRTTMDLIINKKLDRDRPFNQQIVEEYSDFDIVFLTIGK